MTTARERLARVVRQRGGDLAEAALLCCVEVEPDLDVDAELLRLDAMADVLRTGGYQPGDPRADASALATYLGQEVGFSGDTEDYHDPRNGLLTSVLDRRRGLPITLSIVYVAVGRRLGIPAFGINTPGHFLVGVGARVATGGAGAPIVIDPFHGGVLLTEEDVDRRVQHATSGLAHLTRSMLRPATTPTVIRRLLDNLTRDFLAQGDAEDALWTVELKRLLPGATPEDTRTLGELLVQLGRYRRAAETLESYVASAPIGTDLDEVARLAVRARAKMN